MTKSKKLFISLFILANFLMMMRIFMPTDLTFYRRVYKPVDAYLSFFSIYQDWMMFAPNPSKMNVYLSADVDFLDGSKGHYQFPRPSEMSLLQKYTYGEKLRKITEAIRDDNNSFMWKDTARFALRQLKDQCLDKIPLRVHLNRHWSITPPPSEKFYSHGEKLTKYDKYRFYTYEVL